MDSKSEEIKRLRSENFNLKTQLEQNMKFQKIKFLTDLILNSMDFEIAKWQAENLKINLNAKYFKIILCDIYLKENDKKILKNLNTNFEKNLKNLDNVESFFINSNRFVIILKEENELNGFSKIEENAFNLAKQLKNIFGENKNFGVIIAIGKTVKNLSELKNSYFDAEKIAGESEFWNETCIVNNEEFSNTINVIFGENKNLEKNHLVEKIKYAGKNEIDGLVNEFLELLKKIPDYFEKKSVSMVREIIIVTALISENFGGNIKNEIPEIFKMKFIAKCTKNEKSFKTEIRKILEAFLKIRDSKLKEKWNSAIVAARNFINRNYANHEINLNLVAKEVNLSPNHFCTIFTKKCGISFIEYLTKVRITRAQKLLCETSLKCADIAFECGFSDPHYFSYIFKKTCGVTPRVYKNTYSIKTI